VHKNLSTGILEKDAETAVVVVVVVVVVVAVLLLSPPLPRYSNPD
jgi:hypothetical protein